MQVVVAITLAVAVTALWIRRHTWGMPWETAATANVALQTVDVVLSDPPVSGFLDPKLHALTGQWNISDLIGHCCYLIGLAALLYMVMSRLNLTADQLNHLVRERIQLPTILVIAAMAAIFVWGGLGDRYVPDMTIADVSGWLRWYWVVILCACVYLLVYTIRVLLILRRHADFKRTVDVYLCAVGVSMVCCLAFATAIEPLQWLLVRVEVVGYAIAAGYSWRSRVAPKSEFDLQ